ncbi:MAG: hypothetical protein V4620_10955 [Bacteroidota bacterium]
MVKKVIVIVLLFASCSKDCPWPPPNVYFPLRDKNINWLKGLPIDTIITAISNKGRSLSYRLRPSIKFNSFGAPDCDLLWGEEHFLSYASSIYDYNFNILVYRHWEKDKLLVCGKNKFNYFHDDNSGEINLLDKTNKKINISAEKNYYEHYSLDTSYSIIDTFQINSKTYFDVYKIDFIDKKYSIDDKVKTYYLDVKFGVLRFDTFDGEIWTLNL